MNALGFGLVDASILAIAALGFTLQFGVTNYVNFAYGTLLTFGAYMALEANVSPFHIPIWPALFIAGLCTALFGLLLNQLFLAPFMARRRGLIFALIVTFTLSLMLDDIYIVIWGSDFKQLDYSGTAAYPVGPFVWSNYDIAFMLITLSCLVAVNLLLTRTRLGRSMRAMGDDLHLARVCGIRTEAVTAATWIISSFMAGVAGVMLAIEQRTFTTSLGDNVLFLVLGSVILGGIGRPAGAVIGAVIIGIAVQVGVLFIPSGLAPVLVFVALIGVMLLRPEGLTGATPRPPGQL